MIFERAVGRALVGLLATCALLVGCIGCSGDSNSDSGARNESNFSARSVVAFADEVPQMPGAEPVTKGAMKAGAWHRTLEVQAPAADVLAFYQRELPSAGWTEGGTPSTTPGGFEATWRRPGLRLDATVAPAAAGTRSETEADGSTTAGSNTGTTTINLSLRRASGG
jgi:hypothetical protein